MELGDFFNPIKINRLDSKTIKPEDSNTVEQLDNRLKNYGFEMFTKGGDTACRNGMTRIFKKIRGAKRITEDELKTYFKEVMTSIATKHREVWDTEPHYHMRKLTKLCCEQVGYNFNI